MRKNRVPFFSKSYCREMLREFSTTGIVFASIEFVASMLSFFGITQNLLSMLLYGANVYIQSSAVSYVSLFCFVAGFVFVVKHLVRSAWDFRGSIPVAKRTMLISAFTAMLAWAGICAAANILGAFVGSLVSTISNSSVLVPLCAIGGIRLADVPDLIDAGVSGIAVSSAILGADDPEEMMRRFLEADR